MSVVNAFNIFYDTDFENETGNIDKFQISCGRNNISCEDGQSIRVSLQNFNMYKQHYNINEYNNKLKIIYDNTWGNTAGVGNGATVQIEIDSADYPTLGDIAQNIQRKLSASAVFAGFTVSCEPQGNFNNYINSEGVRVSDKIQIKLTDGTGTTLTPSNIQFYADDDTATLLGLKKYSTFDLSAVPSTGGLFSFKSSKPNTNDIVFESRFYGHITTEEHIYLKTDMVSNNLESGTYSNSKSGELHNSNILARIPIDSDFIHYDTSTGTEYFVNIPNKSINEITFMLTDSKNRPIPVSDSEHKSKGHFDLSMVLKVEIIQKSEPTKHVILQTPIPETKLGVLQRLKTEHE